MRACLRPGNSSAGKRSSAYPPHSNAEGARAAGARARAVANELIEAGTAVRYVRTTFLPEDETCFHMFEADSAASIEEVSVRAGLGRLRISPAIEGFMPRPGR